MITKTVKVKSESQWLSKRRRNHDIGIDEWWIAIIIRNYPVVEFYRYQRNCSFHEIESTTRTREQMFSILCSPISKSLRLIVFY